MIRRLASTILLLALSACEPAGPAPDESGAAAAIPPQQAEALYLDKCALCHGRQGDGHGPRRGSLFAKPPDFRQPSWRRGRSLREIRQLIREGRPGSDMPAWKSLGPEQVAGLAEHVLGFAQRPSASEAGSGSGH